MNTLVEGGSHDKEITMGHWSRSLGRRLPATVWSAVMLSAVVAACGQVPLTDLAEGLYLDRFQGGLYENGKNTPPADHLLAGRNRAVNGIRPRNTAGAVDGADGKVILLSIGYSNPHQEFGGMGSFDYMPHTFMGQAESHPVTDQKHLVMMNGARGGQDVTRWMDAASPNYARIRDDLSGGGYSRMQVQAVWLSLNNRIASAPMPSLPAADAEAYRLVGQLGAVARLLRQEYPNLSIAFLSSRTYGGYTPNNGAHPEPYAYETAFANKWLIEAQLRQIRTGQVDPVAGDLGPGAAPLLAWGPYMWADGTTPRGDGLRWLRSDYEPDNVHPSAAGEEKAGRMLLDFFRTSPYAQPWFTDAVAGDANLDGKVDFKDLGWVAPRFGKASDAYWYGGDLNADRVVNDADLALIRANYAGGDFDADWARALASIPEPASLGLLAPAATVLLRRCRKPR